MGFIFGLFVGALVAWFARGWYQKTSAAIGAELDKVGPLD